MRSIISPTAASSISGTQAAGEGIPMRAQSGAAKVPCLIIVARNQLDLWRALARHFARDMKVQVILDRRQRERRQQPRGYEPDRRRTDRRRPPTVEQDLPSRAFVIVRQHLESA